MMCSLRLVCCVVRGQQWCSKGGQWTRSLWRSADSERQITLVSQKNTMLWQTSTAQTHFHWDQVAADIVLLKWLLTGLHYTGCLSYVPQVRSPCWWTGPVLPLLLHADPLSVSNWTGCGLSDSWAPALTSWRETLSSTTASFPSLSELVSS